ncbi:MAG: hypothetical protein ACJ8FY_11050 [Gemmataceae bacterium]
MRQFTFSVALLSLLIGAAPSVFARVPMTRTEGQRVHGVRSDQFVPYLTNGYTAFGAYSVGPYVYASPTVIDFDNPAAKRVYNIIFQGSAQSFGDKSNGAEQRLPEGLR